MNYKTISEVYDANDQIRARFKALIGGLTPEQAAMRENGAGWSVAEIVEHVTIVESGITMICSRLLAAGAEKGGTLAGEARISADFLSKAAASRGAKLEAPDRVHPTGTKSIPELLVALDENRDRLNELQPTFETVDCLEFTFPHPAFGPITAHDWLALVGGHDARHIAQIERVLAG